MKAILLRAPGGPEQLKLEDVSTPEPGRGKVLVKLHAAALNRRDILVRSRSTFLDAMPFIPGSDGAGEVIALGEEVDEINVGDQDIVYPSLNWGVFENHPSASFEILGGPTNGTYAEFIRLPADNVFKMPAGLTFEEAATLAVAGLTAWRALITRARVLPGERVLIPGIGGGAAIFGLQIASLAGARVFVTSHSTEKIERAIALGAEAGVNYTEPDWADRLKILAEGGVEVVFDSVGAATFNIGLELLVPGGRLVTFGTTAGSSTHLEIRTLYHKQISILGTTMGSPKEFREFLTAVGSSALHPTIDSYYPLEQASEAHRRLESGEHFGKIVLRII